MAGEWASFIAASSLSLHWEQMEALTSNQEEASWLFAGPVTRETEAPPRDEVVDAPQSIICNH
jgi:hypothetical protein